MTDWPQWVALILGGTFGGAAIGGIVEVVKTIANRKVRDAAATVEQATAADRLSDSALEFMRQAGEDAKEARNEANQARRDADDARRDASEARREATEARRDAMTAVANMRRLTSAILSPYATLEGLRAMVSDPPSSNGTALVNR
jgi:uncharacterized protein (DUF3084 family)